MYPLSSRKRYCLTADAECATCTTQGELTADRRDRKQRLAACIVCGGTRFVPMASARLANLCQCAQCGLRLLRPQPTTEQLAQVYDDSYYETFGYLCGREDAFRRMKQASSERRLRRAERLVPCGRLLDVGSGVGDLLVAGRRRGWDVEGIEPNEFARGQADRVAPGVSFAGSLEQFDAPDGTFDLVTMLDVIEHLRRPDEAMRRVRAMLRPGGALIVTTPDASCLQARLLGPRWVHYHPDHLWYFTRQTISRLACRAGFAVLGCSRAWKVFNLRYILSVFAQSDHCGIVQRVARLGVRTLPAGLQDLQLPPLPEGLLLLVRRPEDAAPA